MQKWEYLWFVQKRQEGKAYQDVATYVGQLGNEGWELVSVAPQTQSAQGGWDGYTIELLWVFKRPKA